MSLGRIDPFFGARDREWQGAHLGIVTALDTLTGHISVNYVTCPGGNDDVLYVSPGAITPNYGVFALPLIDSWVEVMQVGDRSYVARPFMGFSKSFAGTNNPDTVEEEAGATMQPQVPGEIYINSNFGASFKLVEGGGYSLWDNCGSYMHMDPMNGVLDVSTPGAYKVSSTDCELRLGEVQRLRVTKNGLAEAGMPFVIGMSQSQEFRVSVTPSQVAGVPLSKINIQFGDIWDDGLVPFLNPLIVGKVNYSDLAGLTVTDFQLFRTGGYQLNLGDANQISSMYEAVTGTVTESCVGVRSMSAIAALNTSTTLGTETCTSSKAVITPLLNLTCGVINLGTPATPSICNFNGGVNSVARMIVDPTLTDLDLNPAFIALGISMMAITPTPTQIALEPIACAMLTAFKAFAITPKLAVGYITTGSLTVKVD